MKKNEGTGKITLKTKLPPLSVSPEVWEAQMKRTLKNVSVRPSREHAELIVFLDLEAHIHKATIMKLCLEKALPIVFQEIVERLQGWKNRDS